MVYKIFQIPQQKSLFFLVKKRELVCNSLFLLSLLDFLPPTVDIEPFIFL